jgi:hypothetical protein
MQSYKYFNHAKQFFFRLFKLPANLQAMSDSIYQGFMQNISHSKQLVCVHVRRGDKIRQKSIYNEYSLSLEYYENAISMMRTNFSSLALVFFVGGGIDQNQNNEDRAWVQKKLMEKYSFNNITTLIEPEHTSYFIAFDLMSRCDGLVVSSSTLSWWAGYLNKNASVIVAPKRCHNDKVTFIPEDYYPPNFILIDMK